MPLEVSSTVETWKGCNVESTGVLTDATTLSHSGSLPGIESVEPTNADVKDALAAMDIGEDGSTKLNYFIQTYRACDFPFYGDYAVHRATEEMAGPRQIVVAK